MPSDKEDFKSDYGNGSEPEDWGGDNDDAHSTHIADAHEQEDEDDLVFDSYEGGICPDCENRIPKEAREGENCEFCGHVFYKEHPDDDEDLLTLEEVVTKLAQFDVENCDEDGLLEVFTNGCPGYAGMSSKELIYWWKSYFNEHIELKNGYYIRKDKP